MKKALITKIVVLSLIVLFLVGVIVYGMGNSFGLDSLIRVPVSEGDYKIDETLTEEVGDLDSFDIDWNSGSVVFEVYDGETIEISEYSTKELKEDEKLSMSEDGDTLKIKWDSKSGFNFGFGIYSKKLEIKIPSSMLLGKVKVSSASADVTGAELVANSIDISTASGDMDFSNCRAVSAGFNSASGDISLASVIAKELKADSVSGNINGESCIGYDTKLSSTSGDINFGGSLEAISAESISGDITVTTDISVTEGSLSAVSGNIDFTLPEDCSFTAKHSSVSGNFSTGFTENGKDAVNGDGTAEIKLSTTSGNMKLKGGSAAKSLADPFESSEVE